jgi:hypothetical protein
MTVALHNVSVREYNGHQSDALAIGISAEAEHGESQQALSGTFEFKLIDGVHRSIAASSIQVCNKGGLVRYA